MTDEEINRLMAEIAELKSELTITNNNFENVQKLYDESVKIGQKMNQKLMDAYKKLQTAKSEAVKEFAERLKKHCYIEPKDQRNVVAEIIIDHYVKDMTEPVKLEHNSLCETETFMGE